MCSIKCCGGTVDASACFTVNSKTYGFTSVPFQFDQTTITTIWEAFDLPGLSGTVVIIGNKVAGTTRIAVNGINTTQIIDDETFAVSSDPLDSVILTYTTATGRTTRLSVSISAAKYEY